MSIYDYDRVMVNEYGDVVPIYSHHFEMTKAEIDEANAITIPEGAKLKWSDELGKMVWE